MMIFRIFGIIISGVLLVALLKEPAYADGGVGWIVPAVGGAGAFLIAFPMLVEMYFLRRMLDIKFGNAMVAAFYMNLFSTIAGFLTFLAILFLRFHPITAFLVLIAFVVFPAVWHALKTGSSKLMQLSIIAATIGAMLISVDAHYHRLDAMPDREGLWNSIYWLAVLIYGYGLSLAIEVWPAKRYIPIDRLDSVVITLNMYSYIILFAGWFMLLITRLPYIISG